MNPTLLRVTQRIIERSKETRSAYLARIEQAKSSTVHRSQLACGNLALSKKDAPRSSPS